MSKNKRTSRNENLGYKKTCILKTNINNKDSVLSEISKHSILFVSLHEIAEKEKSNYFVFVVKGEHLAEFKKIVNCFLVETKMVEIYNI